jgi:hypothetical protein
MTPDQWCQRVDDHLRTIGASVTEPHNPPSPVVALVGAYNTGKTSLLRRLLVDEHLPMPEWARVTSREETAEINQVEVLGCTLVDTPGLEGLSEWHGSVTRTALLEADSLVLLTTSNLFAADESLVGTDSSLDAFAVASGKAFMANGLGYPEGGLAVLVTRFDEAAPDPVDFPQAYEDARIRKLVELTALLERRAPLAVDGSYRDGIAGDPFGRTRNRVTTSVDYDAYRSWDNMRGFAQWLGALPAQLKDLRSWRDVRIRAEALTRQIEAQSDAVDQERLREADSKAGHADAVRVQAKCERELKAATARLTAALDRALFTAPAPSDTQFRVELQRHLETELQQWTERVVANLQELADETEVSLPDLAVMDAAEAASRLVTATDRPTSFQQTAQTARRGIDFVQKAMTTLAGADHRGEPSVLNPGGWSPKAWVEPEMAAGINILLTIGSDLLGLLDQESSQRADEIAAQRQRLAVEGARVARQMFVSQASPEGWQGLFQNLISSATESVDIWSGLTESATKRLDSVQTLLNEAEELLSAIPQPPTRASDNDGNPG